MSLLPTSSAAFATTVFRDEPTVLVAQPDGPIHLWRLYSDQVALTDGQGHHGLVTEVTYDQGQTVSRADDDTLLHDGVIQRLTGLSAVARAVLPGGRAVALAAAAQGRLSVLDGKWAERRRRRIARYPSRVSQILSVGDARFVSSAGRHLRHWQLSSHASGQYAAEYFWSRRLPAPATAMALLPDGLLVTTVEGVSRSSTWTVAVLVRTGAVCGPARGGPRGGGTCSCGAHRGRSPGTLGGADLAEAPSVACRWGSSNVCRSLARRGPSAGRDRARGPHAAGSRHRNRSAGRPADVAARCAESSGRRR